MVDNSSGNISMNWLVVEDEMGMQRDGSTAASEVSAVDGGVSFVAATSILLCIIIEDPA